MTIDLSAIKPVESRRLGEVAEIFGRHQSGQARSLQRTIGPSEVGHPCDRHLAFKLAGIPHHVVEPLKWAALLGTWCHGGAEHAMHEENARLGRERYLIERRALINDALVEGGNTDVFDLDALEVIDWKFPGEASAEKSAKEPPAEYVVQGMLYGLGWHRMGHTPRTVRIIFLPRWTNDITKGHEWAAEWSEEVAVQALERLTIIKGASELAVGGLLPWGNIDADTSKCRFCPWLKRRRPNEPQADEAGCHGYFQSNEWMGVETTAARNDVETHHALFSAIGAADDAGELTALWRDYRAHWTDEHTAAAKARKAELTAEHNLPGTPGRTHGKQGTR